MKPISSFVLLLLFFVWPLKAGTEEAVFLQGYTDFRNFLFIFENGAPRQLEQQAVRSFKARGPMIAYANNANDLMVYYGGEKFKLGDMTATNYDVTQSFMYFQRDLLLSVFEQGKVTPLTYFLRDFKVSDSLLVFRDRNVDILRVYAGGALHEIEMTLTGSLQDYKAGENTVAYVNNTGFFRVYMNGQVYDLDNVAPEAYDPGGNLVAYVDGLYHYLKVFYGGKILVLEKLQPQSFKAGVEVVAYVADDQSFKVFSGGRLLKAEAYIPDFYQVRDRSVLFFFNNQLQVLLDGQRYLLDEFMPANYQMSENNIAWTDVSGRLHLFSGGKTHEITLERITGYELNGNTLKYDLPDGTSRIWYKGKIFGNN
ncbi:MAG: hypothetical protein JNL88_06505 [Bacteroidia bacterium]|nr:hypothetical protein [Bacteroidia bacterium]